MNNSELTCSADMMLNYSVPCLRSDTLPVDCLPSWSRDWKSGVAVAMN